MDPLLAILICLLAAALAGELLSALRVPRVVGHISAGLILGIPTIKNVLFDSAGLSLIESLASIGVILLLFFTGLEIDFRRFAANIKTASSISFWNSTLPLAGGFLACYYLFGMSAPVSFIIGVCLSVSAAALGIDMLEEFGMLKTKLGTLIVSAGTVDDVYELILITITLAVIEVDTTKTALITLGLNALMFAAAIVAFRAAIVPFIFNTLGKRTDATLLMGGLIVTLLMAGLSNYLGFGSLMGALISGIIVRQALLKDVKHHRPWEEHHISKTIHTISFGFLVPLFFVHVGMLTDITAVWDNLGFSAVITLIAISGTVIGCAIAYYLANHRWKEGWLLGWALNSKGDTEIVIASLALGSGIISPAIFSSLIFMAIVSTLVSPLVFRHLLAHQRIR